MRERSSKNVPANEPQTEFVGGAATYTVERWLGAGGMADVLLCTMRAGDGFARTVAVKVVRAGFAQYPEFCDLFIQEAGVASRLQHPNIVNVEYFGRDERGRPFLVMEFVDGIDLAALMASGPIPASLGIFIASEVLRALVYAHEAPQADGHRGIVHRDVSPSNILLSKHGIPKLADFGIAKAITDSTNVSAIKGKVSYMSPEQVNGEPLDGRSDLFAVGIVLWELLTGQRLFGGMRTKETFARISLGEIPPPRSVRPVGADVERVVLKLLAKEPGERYASADDALAALLECADAPRDGHRELAALIHERSVAPATEEQPTNTVHTAEAPSGEELAPVAPGASKRRPRLVRRVLLAATVATGIAVATLSLRGQEPPGTALKDRAPPVFGPEGAPAAKPPVANVSPVEPAPLPAEEGPTLGPPRPALVRTNSSSARKATRSAKPAPTAAPASPPIIRTYLQQGVPEKP